MISAITFPDSDQQYAPAVFAFGIDYLEKEGNVACPACRAFNGDLDGDADVTDVYGFAGQFDSLIELRIGWGATEGIAMSKRYLGCGTVVEKVAKAVWLSILIHALLGYTEFVRAFPECKMMGKGQFERRVAEHKEIARRLGWVVELQ